MIESTHVAKSDYGVVTVLINTKEKWENYSIDEFESVLKLVFYDENSNELIIVGSTSIPLELNKEEEFRYIMTHQQDKDQIVVYLVPLRLVKGDAFVDHVKSAMLKNKP